MSYHSFRRKGSMVFLRDPFPFLERRLFLPTAFEVKRRARSGNNRLVNATKYRLARRRDVKAAGSFAIRFRSLHRTRHTHKPGAMPEKRGVQGVTGSFGNSDALSTRLSALTWPMPSAARSPCELMTGAEVMPGNLPCCDSLKIRPCSERSNTMSRVGSMGENYVCCVVKSAVAAGGYSRIDKMDAGDVARSC